MADQPDTAIEQNGTGDLVALLAGGEAWTVAESTAAGTAVMPACW